MKNLKTHILFISILSASELSEARIALPFFQRNCRTQQRRRLIVIAQSFYKERVSALADVGGVKVFRAPSGYGTVELTIVDSEWSVPSSTMIYATGLKGDVWQALLNRVSYIQKGGVKLSLAK